MPPQQLPTQTPHNVRTVILTALITMVCVGALIAGAHYLGYMTFSPISFTEDQAPEDLDMILRGLEEIATTGSSSIPVMMEEDGNATNYYLGNPTASADVREGVYSLVGKGAGQTGTYKGTVSVSLRAGSRNIYDLMWKIAGNQEQWGVGIFHNGILSVGYYEQYAGEVREAGVVSYVVQRDHLEGEWTSLQGGGTGVEQLEWLSQ